MMAVISVSAAITEHRAGEEAGQGLAAIVAGSGDAIFGSDPNLTITSWNRAAEYLFGYPAAEIIGQSVALLAPPGRLAEQAETRAALSADEPVRRFETVRRHQDGHLVEVLLTASRATDAAGVMIGFSVIARDIAEHLETRRALEASQRRLIEAQRIAHVGSFELDLVTGDLTWSDEHYRILGLDPGVWRDVRTVRVPGPSRRPGRHRDGLGSGNHTGRRVRRGLSHHPSRRRSTLGSRPAPSPWSISTARW